MMAEFNYFHPPPVVKHADKWANKMAHHHFSIVPSCVYMIMRVGGSFLYLHKPESLLIQKGTQCLCLPLHALALCVNMLMHMKFWYLSDMQIPDQSTIMTKSPHVVPCSHPGLMQDKYQCAHYLHCFPPTNIHIHTHSLYTFFCFFFFFFGGRGELCLINCIPLPPLLNRWGKYPLYNKSLLAYN